MKNILITSLLLGTCALALAKLPELGAEAKAKAAETAAKAAWTSKVNAFQLCQSQDKVAARYNKSAEAASKVSKPAVATPPCAEPGAFSYVAPEADKPLEASGAHSPAATAVSPPSSKAVDAAINPDKKP